MMTKIIWHGRGGQGAFTAAKLLGAAYSLNGRYALAFPSFGPERRGAPVKAFTKLDEIPISDRSENESSDYSVFLDDTLFSESAFSEINPGGFILINTKRRFDNPGIIAFDADSLAEKILGLPVANTVMLGVLAAVFGKIPPSDFDGAIKLNMPPKIQKKNIAALREAARIAKEKIDNETLSQRKISEIS